MSRADLARRTGLSPSTVSAIVGDLERSGLVQSTGAGLSRGGRRPTLIGFYDDAFAIVGVELGASHVLVTLTNLRGQVRSARHGAHAVQGDPDGALAMVRAFIDDCLRAERVPRRRLLGIGVAVPSPVHPTAPGRLSPLIVPAWSGYDVQEHLSGAYNVPVFVDNDANLGALAEGWWGAGRSRRRSHVHQGRHRHRRRLRHPRRGLSRRRRHRRRDRPPRGRSVGAALHVRAQRLPRHLHRLAGDPRHRARAHDRRARPHADHRRDRQERQAPAIRRRAPSSTRSATTSASPSPAWST